MKLEIALQFSYKGFYFNTIADDIKHSYNFFFGEVLLNINELIIGKEAKRSKWSVIFHPGAGLFNNKYYQQINICGNIGIMNSYKIYTTQIGFRFWNPILLLYADNQQF